MNNDNSNTRGLPFSHSFNFGTTIQNVFRNINHAFASNHGSSSAQQTDNGIRDAVPPLEALNSAGGGHETHLTDSTHPSFSSAVAPDPSSSPPADVDMSAHSLPPSQPEDDEDSMPELRSVSESSDDSDLGAAAFHPAQPPHPVTQPIDDDRDSAWTDDESDPTSLEPIAGTRRARVDDDGDDARDRRHPSERVGGAPPPPDAAPQNANREQPPRLPTGFFVPLFGSGTLGDNQTGGDALPERVQTGETSTDPSAAGNDPTPGHPPRGVPIMTAGFTFTIPLFGPQAANQAAPGAGMQGAAHGVFGMDPSTREELLASFAAFFQEFQAMDEAREDPERAKKLLAGLDVVPLGLVKRLERVGGAPGGHIGDTTTEGTSGCAICWDTLLDAESDSFSGQHSSGGEAPQSLSSVSETNNTVQGQSGGEAMDVDAPSVPPLHLEQDASTSTPPFPELPQIISLPCAHVFHASCLLPWFTRAKQATCPTCRFNIDPENLTYTAPPRRPFPRPRHARADNAAPGPPPLDPQHAPEVPAEAPSDDVHATDAAAPAADPARTDTDMTHAAAAPASPGHADPPPTGQAGVPLPGPGVNPFLVAGIPILSFPAIQIPLRQTGAQGFSDNNQGIDVVTIGLDMFVGGPPPDVPGGDPRDNADAADGADDHEGGTGTAGGDGAADPTNPNGLAQDLQSLIEGILRTTRNIIPQVINAQGPAPPAAGDQPQPQAAPGPEAAGPQPGSPPLGGPRVIPGFQFRPNVFRPMRPMPRQEPKTWTLPSAPGPSLRQRVEQREREQGLRCSDTSCGVGPSDDDPYPDPSTAFTKQVRIHPLPDSDSLGSVCAHSFHLGCLVSAERVAGWGGEDKTEPLVEVSCPVCRAVGCVTREEWETGVSAL